jgi:hypothetical protein
MIGAARRLRQKVLYYNISFDLMAHDHAPHSHPHDRHHGGDAHGHAHDPELVRPSFSLLRLSALERLAGAVAISAAIWAGTLWALR